MTGPLRLHVSDDDLASCVGCGLCLPHCPTYRVSGEEAASPRGRIALMREVQWQGAAADDDFARFMDACVQCRGCEVACPSGVPFGRLMEGTKEALAQQRRTVPPMVQVAYRALGHHRVVLAASTAAAVAQRLRVPLPAVARSSLPSRLPLRRPRLRPSGHAAQPGAVTLFTGCVMDAWQRPVHLAVQQVLEATGTPVAFPVPVRGGGCCGALHVHAGLTDQARSLVARMLASMPGDGPVLVDSAGCGAALKDVGHLLGTPEAHEFAARVHDVHEWLAARMHLLPRPAQRFPQPVAVQDPCHLRHVQRAHTAVRSVLAPYATVVELDDDGLCCGAGGSWSALHPVEAAAIRDRKLAAVARSGAAVVASANPGCQLHLQAAALDVRHPLEIVAACLAGAQR